MDISELKGRIWAFVLYPDSCAYDYVDMIKRLDCLKIPMAISPLHIPAKNTGEHNELKEHYHCLIYFDGVKKEKDLKKLIDFSSSKYDMQYFDWALLVDKDNISKKKGKYPYFKKINSIGAYFRYLIHLDNPDKQQFKDYKICNFVTDDEQKYNTIVLLNGFSEKDYLKNSDSNPDFVLLNIVKENQIEKISDLMGYLAYNKNQYLMNYIKKNMMWIRTCLLPDLFFRVSAKEKENEVKECVKNA